MLRAKRATKADNPIIWLVEAAVLVLNMIGNMTAAKVLRLTAATTCAGAFCIALDPLAGLALINGLLEEESGA